LAVPPMEPNHLITKKRFPIIGITSSIINLPVRIEVTNERQKETSG